MGKRSVGIGWCISVVLALSLPAWTVTPRLPSDEDQSDRNTSTQIELSCKIVPAPGDRGYKLWRVDLRKPSGELVRRTIKGSGDTVHFKELTPGIYLTCVAGDKSREHCQSVDLVPPAGHRTYRFSAKIEAPRNPPNQTGAHRVNVRRLSVPKEAHQELARAESARQRGEKSEVLRHLERALQLHPTYPEALNNIGVYFHREHDFNQSAKYFTQATGIDPDFYPAWINLGGTLLSAAKFEDALVANKRAHALRPDEALSNSQLAMSYYYLRDYDEAKKYFKRVQDIDPLAASSPQLYLAHIALAQKNEAEAEIWIRNFLRLHPNSPRASSLKDTLDFITKRSGASAYASKPIEGP